tara:strand:- start:111 stop:710 length:600 start_codon:yes stop_codon:yes gene_type:complete
VKPQKSINKISKSIFKDRGSKFYAFLHPVETVDSYRYFIRRYKQDNMDACHVCSAYRIYLNDWIDEYAADDGEPKGSSGLPILNALKKHRLVNAAIYVVRIYGGVNLGIPGLINAYNTSALQAITDNNLIDWEPLTEISIKYSYSLDKTVLSVIKLFNGKIIKQSFDEQIISNILIKKQFRSKLINLLSDRGSGKIIIL